MYTPDAWRIVKITNPEGESHFRVFTGWYGGYLGSDSWQMNSGITKVEKPGEYLLFHGVSGSIYQCHPNIERCTGYMAQVFEGLRIKMVESGANLEYVDYADFIKEFKSC